MKRSASIRCVSTLGFILFSFINVQAQIRSLAPPLPNLSFYAEQPTHAFAHSGRVGLSVVLNNENKASHIFSYNIERGTPGDLFDLLPEYGVGGSLGLPIYLRAHGSDGAFIVYGLTSNRAIKIVGFSVDESGVITRLWGKEFPPEVSLIIGNTAFNRNGSRLFLLSFVATRPVLFMLRFSDGETISSLELPPSLEDLPGLLFDDEFNRAIVLANENAYVIAANEDRLDLLSTIEQSVNCHNGVGITLGGRFAIAYAGYQLPINSSDKSGENVFCAYDLERGAVKEFQFATKNVPSIPSMVFHSATGNLLIPYTATFKKKSGGRFSFITGKNRSVDMLSLSAQGELSNAFSIKLPELSQGSSEKNIILPWNDVQFSQSGAIGFASARSGRIFAFDTLTGEIVNEIDTAGPNDLPIHLVESLGVMVCGADGRIRLVEVSASPVIIGVEIKRKSTIIKGANFLSGARVLINGQEVVADRNPENPGRELSIKKGSRDFPSDQELSIAVVNRDGLASKIFTVKL